MKRRRHTPEQIIRKLAEGEIAFELYATDTWSIDALQDELTQRGLRTRPIGRKAATAVSTSKLAKLLRDPYYCGFVKYKGEIIKGRHEPLISQELEAAIERLYKAMRFDTELANRIRTAMHETIEDRDRESHLMARQLKAELKALDNLEQRLIDLAADGSIDRSAVD